MANESMPVRDPQRAQQQWNRVTAAAGLPQTDVNTGARLGATTAGQRLRAKSWWLPFLGFSSVIGRVAVVLGVVGIAAYSFGRSRGPAPAGATGVDHSVGVPAQPVEGSKSFTAPAGDSLHVTILNGSSAVLAPGSTLTVTPRPFTNGAGAVADLGTLTGGARFDINAQSKLLTLQTHAGRAVLNRGITELTIVGDTLVARAITGGVFVKPGGLYSWKPLMVKPGFELRAPIGSFVTGRLLKPITGAR